MPLVPPGSRASFCAMLIITPHCLHTNREILRIAYPQYFLVLLPSERSSLALSLPLSAASGHKRYNTLDLALTPYGRPHGDPDRKIVCQQGRGLPVATAAAGSSADRAGRRDLLTPIGNPEPRGLRPSGHPIIFCANGTHIEKIHFPMSAHSSKMPQYTSSIFAGALQKFQLVPWCAEQNFRDRRNGKFPRHAAAAGIFKRRIDFGNEIVFDFVSKVPHSC